MEALHQFDPNTSSQQLSFWLSILITLLALGGLIYFLKLKTDRDNHNRNMLAAMLLFFVVLIAGSTAFFSSWSNIKTGKVLLYEDRIKTAYGIATFDQIKKAYIEESAQPSLINPNINRKTVKMLIIEEANGQAHILSEKDYQVKEIFRQLKEAIEKWKSTNGNKE